MPLFRRSATEDGARWVVIGLGNPGEAYARTRHNTGAMVLHQLVERCGARLKTHKSGCLVAEAQLAGERVVLARPMSYMNESGRPAAAVVRWYKAGTDKVLVLHDELDIPFGEIRIKAGGGTAGHNGLRSIAAHLGSNDFIRVRIGISRPTGRKDAVDHVLEEFAPTERKQLPDVVASAADATERVVAVGVERAMNEVNTRS